MPKTVAAIQKARSKGILFGLSTGRDAASCRNLLKKWNIAGLVDLIVGMGGGEIDDLVLGVQKSSYLLDGGLIQQIIQHYVDMDVNFYVPKNGVLLGYRDDGYIRMLAEVDQQPYKIVDFNELLQLPQGKVVIICAPDYMPRVIERSKTFNDPNNICTCLKTASILFEYMDPRVSKTSGLNEVMQLHGWTLENLIAFGDADNDTDMIKNAGIGVSMKNGSEKTKSAADYITSDNDNDGIALFLETNVFFKLG
jgi:Cof subfamily protein (haloacid dehalogenase superfamily)